MKTIHPFWGWRMRACMDWAVEHEIPLNIKVGQFGEAMNRILLTNVSLNQSPEYCAELWLRRINEIQHKEQ